METFGIYRVIEQIGKGTFGQVFTVTKEGSEETYALKKINLQLCDKKDREHCSSEVRLLEKSFHRHLVRYHDYFLEENYMHIVMEYCQRGSLSKYIQEQVRIDELECISILIQVCEGLKYLHDQNIVHRDLKTTNIFLTDSMEIKLGDLALARIIDNTQDKGQLTKYVGTPFYMSPEIIKGLPYDKKTDIWSLGCDLYEIATKKQAFCSETITMLRCKIEDESMSTTKIPYCKDMNKLCRDMVAKNQETRPPVEIVLQRLLHHKSIASDTFHSGGHAEEASFEEFNIPTGEIETVKPRFYTSVSTETLKTVESEPLFSKFATECSDHSLKEKDNEKWSEWIDNCSEEHARQLLQQNSIPSNAAIQYAVNAFGRKSKIFKEMCDKVCSHLTSLSEYIKCVWTAYRQGYENDVIFVVIQNNTDGVNIFDSQEYTLVHRRHNEYSSEGKEILYSDASRGKVFSFGELGKIKTYLQQHTKSLFEEHENLGQVSACSVKSIGYGTEAAKVIYETCIVLYVHVKHLIPIQDEPFPKVLHDVPVDVREGGFEIYHANSKEYQNELKMGSAISGDSRNSNGEQFIGTLGAFLDIDKSTYCLTCAHVLLNGEEMEHLSLTDNGTNTYKREVYQPYRLEEMQSGENCDTCFGELVKAIYQNGGHEDSGIDIALIRVCKRHPVTGSFPDGEIDRFQRAGFTNSSDMQYTSGLIYTPDTFTNRTDVVKFGCQTEVTRGSFHLSGTAVRRINDHGKYMDFGYELHNQLEFLSIGPAKFAKSGDSGAPVFVPYQNNNADLRLVGLLEGGTSLDTYIVTPIWCILSKLGLPPVMKQFPLNAQSQQPNVYYNRSESNLSANSLSLEASNELRFTQMTEKMTQIEENVNGMKEQLESQEQNIAQDLAKHSAELKNEMSEIKHLLIAVLNKQT